MKSLLSLVVVSLGLCFLSGCASTHSVRAKPLTPVYGQDVDLSKYEVVSIQPLEVNTSRAANDHAGEKIAEDIAHRLQYDFGPLFQTVRMGPPLGTANELVLSGRITDYRPGSRAARLLGPGIGRADLKGELVLKDGATGQPVMIAPIDKLWAWGDALGAAKGIDNMMDETAASAANMIARAKGWQPQNQASVR